MVQRVINALAAQETGEISSASEALAQDALNALADENNLTQRILGRFETSGDVGTRILPLARETLARLRNPRYRDHLLRHVRQSLSRAVPSQFLHLRWLEQQGLKVQLLRDGTAGSFVPPGWPARAEEFPSPAKEALIPVLREANNMLSVPWKVCRLCARPFPQAGTVAGACPVCGRRYESALRVHRRLKRAPKDAVVFRVTPPGVREPLWLVIAPGVDAPPALRRIAHAPPTAEDKAALQAAALKESTGGSDPAGKMGWA